MRRLKVNTTTYDPAMSSSSAVEGCNKSLTCTKCVASGTQCAFEDTYLTCDLSNLTASCSVAGGIYRDSVMLDDLQAKESDLGAS